MESENMDNSPEGPKTENFETSAVPKRDSGVSLSKDNDSLQTRNSSEEKAETGSTGSASSTSSSGMQKTKKSDSGCEKDDRDEDMRHKRKKKKISAMAEKTASNSIEGASDQGMDVSEQTTSTTPNKEASSPEPMEVPVDGMLMKVRLTRNRRNYRRRAEDGNDDENIDNDDDDDNVDEEEFHSAEDGGDVDEIVATDSDMPGLISDTTDMSSDEEAEQQRQPRSVRPTWLAVPSLCRRELGQGPRYDPLSFLLACSRSLHHVERFDIATHLTFHHGCVNTLHFNQSGTWLASGSDDLKIAVWDWTRPAAPLFSYSSGHRSNVFQAKFMPECGDSQLVSCARDGQVRLSTLSQTGTCTSTKKLAHHRGSAHKLALEPESPNVFLSCGEDSVVNNIDLRLDKPDNKLLSCKMEDKNLKIPLYTIHTNPSDVHQFAVGGRCQWARIFDKRMISNDAKPLKRYCPENLKDEKRSKANITCLTYNYNGTELLCSYNDEHIYLFDATHSTEAPHTHVYKGHRNNATVKGVNFYGPRSEAIVSGSDCGNIFLWEKQSEKVIKYMAGDEGGVVNVLEPHPYYPVLATSGLDHDAKIWLPTGDGADLSNLSKVMNRNKRERETDRAHSPTIIDDNVFLYLMNHIRGRRRMRRHQQEDNSDSDSVSDDSNAENDGTSGSDSDADRPTCTPS